MVKRVRKVYVYVYPSISEWLKLIQLLNEDCHVCTRTACMAWTGCSTYVHRLCLSPTRWVHTDTLWQRCPVARSRRCRWIHRWLRSCLCHCHTSCNRCPEEREGCSDALFTKRDGKILENSLFTSLINSCLIDICHISLYHMFRLGLCINRCAKGENKSWSCIQVTATVLCKGLELPLVSILLPSSQSCHFFKKGSLEITFSEKRIIQA